MFGKGFRLFNLPGFEVKLGLSWIIIAILIVWSLSKGLYPFHFKGLFTAVYWIMGIAGALGLFVSIIVHEFSHSFVARTYGLPMKRITLFIFAGVAEMSEEPPSAKVEFKMAIAGPISNLILGFFFFVLLGMGKVDGWPPPINGILA
jgi:Zn-dependent protease